MLKSLYKEVGLISVIIENKYEISGFGRLVVQTFALLGCYTAYVDICLPTCKTSLSVQFSLV